MKKTDPRIHKFNVEQRKLREGIEALNFIREYFRYKNMEAILGAEKLILEIEKEVQ